ncbi:pyrroline-5-carboxylate reductase [Marinobacterium lutimaris]|uniref:Pyrroline-5-carboxylate reductase n=1 Tax=Marinobacterium lutimaris TaxID=568106 RepID=A0A1H6DW06_9GAMM|nr:pyrroline-5-carboxylate reductase [Marinobacterium lutimaris]SEG88913.1 pyrroline-5-carboxylate reductase [Marinobacterium lutimaris]
MITDINKRGLVLIGCGRMGGALLKGWIASGVKRSSIQVVDLLASEELKDMGIKVGGEVPSDPACVILAVKPQSLANAANTLPTFGSDTTVVSVIAGKTIESLEVFFPNNPIIRTMPNTPAMIQQGVTAIVGNKKADGRHIELARQIMMAVGHVVELENESQIDAVTALSGSGPAYVFHMIEAMTVAGEHEGLPPEIALELAIRTVFGAGMLALKTDDHPSLLRQNVTSPNGTTEAALKQLMNLETGLTSLMMKAVTAAANRSRELAKN